MNVPVCAEATQTSRTLLIRAQTRVQHECLISLACGVGESVCACEVFTVDGMTCFHCIIVRYADGGVYVFTFVIALAQDEVNIHKQNVQ